jgi:hypothetical protein
MRHTMKIITLLIIVIVLAGCTTFQYERTAESEYLKGTTWFKQFKDIKATRPDFTLEIGESNVDAPDISGDMVCMAKLQRGLDCE